MSEPFNVVLITIDAWRADFVSSWAGIPMATAIEGPNTAIFERAYTTAPWTTPALVSILTGEPAKAHGVHYAWSSPRPESPSVVKSLEKAGWVCPNLVYLNCLDNYINLGYEREDAPDYPKDPTDDLLTPALGQGPEPHFLWFHYKWIHLPWWGSPQDRAAMGVEEQMVSERVRDSVASQFVVPRGQYSLLPEDQDVVRRLYGACVRRMNAWLEGVLDTIASGPAADRTCVVLTADHGDELLEHGHVGHASTAHNATLFEEVLRIPLVVIDPRIDGARRVETRVQSLDLYSTILALAGAPPADHPTQSLDLTPAIFGAADAVEAHAERVMAFHSGRAGYLTPKEQDGHVLEGFSDGRYKYVEKRYGGVERSIYDLREDPDELAAMTVEAFRQKNPCAPAWLEALL